MIELSKKQKNLIKATRKNISKTIFQQQLIQENDNVVIGLSGGKDSFVLLDTLADRKKSWNFNFQLVAVYINVVNIPYEVDFKFMKEFCDSLKVKLHKIDINVDFEKDKKISACFKCSWHRRTALFKFVTQKGFNKLAFGHHLDDAVETLLLNMSFNAEISSMPFKISMLNNKFEIIRPMLETEEKYIIEYAQIMNFNREVKICPYAEVSKRDKIRSQIAELENLTPNFKKNVFRSMYKILPDYLPIKKS